MQQGWVPAQTPWQLAQYYQMLSQQQPQQPKANPMRDLVSKGVNEGVNKLASDYLPSIFGDAGSVMPSTEALPWTQGFGSDMIGTQAAPGAFDLAGIGSAGNAFLPLAGAAGAYDTLTHDRGIASGALRGAASGAAIGSFFPGPGTAVGAGIGALIGGGASIVNGMGDKDAYKTEWKRKKDLYSSACTGHCSTCCRNWVVVSAEKVSSSRRGDWAEGETVKPGYCWATGAGVGFTAVRAFIRIVPRCKVRVMFIS